MKKTFRDHHLYRALEAFDFTTPLDLYLGHYFRQHKAIGSKDRKTIAEKIYSMIRWLGLIDHHCDGNHTWENRYEVWKELNIPQKIQNPLLPPHIRASCPKDLFALLQTHLGEERALSFCHVSNQPAPTTVRVNPLKTNRLALFAAWKEQFAVSLTPVSVHGICFENKLNFHLLEDFQQGLFEVQDEGSQLVADLVEAKPGDQVLDFCAGSGGKTLAFAHKLQGSGQIYLHDVRPGSLERAKKRLKRAGIENSQILLPHSPEKEKLKGKMDWVLVDAPCSGLGTLRRNPDLKWKFSKESLTSLVQEQQAIFEEALAYLKPTGRIVYATCSILPQENEEQIVHFERRHPIDLDRKPFRSLPSENGMDGFFAATFKWR